MEYLSIKEISQEWKISPRRVQVLCNEGRLKGAKKIGNMWVIPSGVKKPNPANKRHIENSSFSSFENTIKLRKEVKRKIYLTTKELKLKMNDKEIREVVLSAILLSVLEIIFSNNKLYVSYTYDYMRKINTKYKYNEEKSTLIKEVKNKFNFKYTEIDEINNLLSWSYQYLNVALNDNDYKGTQFFTEEYMIKFLINNIDNNLDGKVVDICCGGGNFLTYAFLKKMEAYKHIDKDKIKKELSYLYGYDIDKTIANIAYTNIVITALAYAASKDIYFHLDELYLLNPNIFVDCKNSVAGSLDSDNVVISISNMKKGRIIDLLGKADFLLTNPPFATIKGMDQALKEYLKKNFSETNCDIGASFLEKSFDYLSRNGRVGLVVQNSWMFLDSLSQFRKAILEKRRFMQIVDLGSSSFVDINGEKSSVSLLTGKLKQHSNVDYSIEYMNLSKYKIQDKAAMVESTPNKNEYWTNINLSNVLANENSRFDLMNIGNFRDFYYSSNRYSEFAVPMQGTSTGNNKLLVDYFWNHFNDVEWCLVSKGGGYCRWQGLNRYVLKWGRNGEYIKKEKGSALRNISHFERTELAFSDTGTSGLNVRLLLPGEKFIASGPGIRLNAGDKYAHLCFLNSRVSSYYIQMLTPKLTIAAGYISKLPTSEMLLGSPHLANLGRLCCDLKEHSLIYRPNNIEYSSFGFIEKKDTVLENAKNLFYNDCLTYLQLMQTEKMVDDYICKNVFDLAEREMRLLDSQMGIQPMSYTKEIRLNSTIIDNTIALLLDESCVATKTKIGSIRYGADNFLEYISRKYSLNPIKLFEVITQNIDDCEKVLEMYSNLLLHNAVLNCFGYNTKTGFKYKKKSISEVVDYLQTIFNDENVDMDNWLRNVFLEVHTKIFKGTSLLDINKRSMYVSE